MLPMLKFLGLSLILEPPNFYNIPKEGLLLGTDFPLGKPPESTAGRMSCAEMQTSRVHHDQYMAVRALFAQMLSFHSTVCPG